ncbi:MAG: response regulator [Pseudodesulfovibrio sp.]|uniref:Response regulator receiver n=1 Tax=Pseudodesulfovibrio aespoeensis (strain ATCC 700646 / DSM 10631 / Aspo-2) TaxID=643562 RepID=E6VWS8_PSEA9|nr:MULTISPECIES: HD domain-containing phosphohydrolase [Pseudodesulfovibrio]MBU4192428.1 response regulator [Pseudomonadota bacterium]ADU63690.1 response regulator receiver [Pseudodesulfovibrio aespoeensis Aspo-2]MBU4244973.1 response regulator [Pseudomonadota bacterium]MBU4379294.1 response regulator [Pseudomonadota bacterium]MBU4476344.1 response regulator [Pseudomonadota bacterium]
MKSDPKVLFVDDEQNILDTYRVSLRRRFTVDTAPGPAEGLEKFRTSGPYGVVVSDLKMPGMDGIKFLKKVQELSPDTVRVMLTGHADVNAAISAVNDGAVFRFLTKPSSMEEMIRTLEVAMGQYSLVIAERELLRGTLRGSVKVLTDILGLVNPAAFGRSERVRRLATYVSQRLGLRQTLSLDLAAMLCQLGCVTLTDTVLEKVFRGETLTPEEQQAFDMHPMVTAGMLARIPRMGRVSEIILHQNDSLADTPSLSIEARILKVCLDYDAHTQRGMDKQDAIDALRGRAGVYDPKVLDILELGTAGGDGYVRRDLELKDLRQGMILDEPLWSLDKVHIMAEGTEITETALMRVHNFAKAQRLPGRLRVLVPVEGG